MNMDLHSTGASHVAGKKEHNPRDLIIEIIKQMPEADRKDQFEKFRTKLAEMGDSYQRTVDYYFFVNMHDYLTTNRSRHRFDSAAASQQVNAMAERVVAQVMLLDLTMTNGKPMKECTGAEMAKFGNRYQRIAEKVGKAKLVGAVLNEDQVKAIMK